VAPDVFSADGKGGRIVLYTQVLLVRCFRGTLCKRQAVADVPVRQEALLLVSTHQCDTEHLSGLGLQHALLDISMLPVRL